MCCRFTVLQQLKDISAMMRIEQENQPIDPSQEVGYQHGVQTYCCCHGQNNFKKPTNCGLRGNATCSKHEMFTNQKSTHHFVLTLNAKCCSICHRLPDINDNLGRPSCAPYYWEWRLKLSPIKSPTTIFQ